jgi:uncharacterized membrane protein YccF (DUF307 family)
MRLLLNILWFVLCGLWMAIGYAIAALICFILIITIPFGGAGAGSAIGNVIWFVLCGWWLALGHIITGALLCLTIIGIPFGIANFKLIPVSLLPFGRDVVTIEQAARLGYQAEVAIPPPR